jgi:hypothetical protein
MINEALKTAFDRRRLHGIEYGRGNRRAAPAPVGLSFPAMDDRIEFISSYCDRWCERCAFTSRCSAYACQIAVGMCGDVDDAIELAIGTPQPVGGERDSPEWSAALDHLEVSPDEAAQYVREERERTSGSPHASTRCAPPPIR